MRLLVGLFASWSMLILVTTQGTPKLSTELALQAQVQQLTEQLAQAQQAFAQCRAGAADVQAKFDSFVLTAQNAELKTKHDELEKELKKALGGTEQDTIDWTTTPPSLKKAEIKKR